MAKRSKKNIVDASLQANPLPEEPKLIAKRDFVIFWNGYFRKITVGDDLSDVPEMFHENLKTEKVI